MNARASESSGRVGASGACASRKSLPGGCAQHDGMSAERRHFGGQRNEFAAPLQELGGEEHARARILQACGDRAGAEAREDRHYGEPRLEAPVEDGENLRNYRYTERYAVAGLEAEGAQSVGHAIGLLADFMEGDGARVAVLAFPKAGHAIAIRPAVEAIVRDVELSAGEPLRPLRTVGRVEYLPVWLKPLDAHLAHQFVPEALGILAGEAQERLAVVKSEALHEAPDVGGFDPGLSGIPDHAKGRVALPHSVPDAHPGKARFTPWTDELDANSCNNRCNQQGVREV